MSRSSVKWCLALTAVVVAFGSVEAQRQRGVPRFKEELRVTPESPLGRAGSIGDHFLTFNRPFSLPSSSRLASAVSLAPGTYIFRTGPSRTLNVVSADRSMSYTWVHTLPAHRSGATNAYEVWFDEPRAEGAPRPLIAWFLPNEHDGYELSYADAMPRIALNRSIGFRDPATLLAER